MIKLNYEKIKIEPELLLGRMLFEELIFQFHMFLTFLHYPVAIVAAEVGKPAFRDTPHAVGFGGSEVFVIQPPLHRAEVISEKLGDLSVGQRVRLESPFTEEKGGIFFDLLVRQISYLR